MFLFFWLFNLLVAMVSPSLATKPAPIKATLASSASSGQAVTSVTTTPGSSTQAAGWQYQQKVEPSGGVTYRAILNSSSQIQLPYPSTGGSTVTLTLRARSGSPATAYFSVTNGLLTKSFQGGNAQIRFNANKAVVYSVSAAANGSGNLVFIDDVQRFIRQLKTARAMTVQLTLANQPLGNVRFNPAGLRWNH